MPLVKTLSDRVEKYVAKTPPDVTGTRYGDVKDIAVLRFVEGVGSITYVRELVRNLLETKGVPAGFHGMYYAFAFKLVKAAYSHTGTALDKIKEGLKAWFVAKGADPAILDEIAKLVF